MPNWCENKVTITHDDSEEIMRIFAAFNLGTLLQQIDPMPDHPEPVAEASIGFNSTLPAWYSWRIAHWGTKWDIGTDGEADMVSANILKLSFDSAWSPPIQAYEKLVELGFVVDASYHEGGGCFIGTFVDGEDNYIDYEELSDIPEHLAETWNMADYFARWDDEDEE